MLSSNRRVTVLIAAAAALYALNRFVWLPAAGGQWPFLSCYLNDVLFVPVTYPLFAGVLKLIRLRPPDWRPGWEHPALYAGVCGALFEGIFPGLLRTGTADGIDCLCYGIGALLFLLARGGPPPGTGARGKRPASGKFGIGIGREIGYARPLTPTKL